MKVYRLWVLFEPNFSCIIWENTYAFDEIPKLISSIWNKHYIFCFSLGGGGGEGACRCDINFTEVWSIFRLKQLIVYKQIDKADKHRMRLQTGKNTWKNCAALIHRRKVNDHKGAKEENLYVPRSDNMWERSLITGNLKNKYNNHVITSLT